MSKETVKLTVRIPGSYLRDIDFLVEAEDFPSRSEVIRTAVRDLVNNRLELVMGNLERKMVVMDRMAQLEEIQKKFLSK
jgi:Arc/MetJ-type ribon-helix-helix transcriptional regulator